MGCCQSNLDIEEIVLSTLDNLNIHDPCLTQTEEGFSDVSLESHQEFKYEPQSETTRTRFADTSLTLSRAKSMSFHRNAFESALLNSAEILKKLPMISQSEIVNQSPTHGKSINY